MAKVNQSSLKQWADGQTMHGPDYNQERDLIVAAFNDTQDQVTLIKGPDSIGASQIQNGAVTRDKISDGAVTISKLAQNSVDSSKLANGSVNADKIVDGSVTTSKLVGESVTTPKIADNAVTTAKIGSGAITALKMGGNSVGTSALQNNSVTTDKIADGAVTTSKIAEQMVTTSKIAEGAVTPERLSAPYYTASQTDEQIRAALSGGLPQDVIDQIVEAAANIPDATTSTKGLVQLSNSITSQSITTVATSKAVDDARTSAMSMSLPRAGGDLTGPLRVSSWGMLSASSGGLYLVGHNCYLDAAGAVFRYRNNHATMGARGIVFRLGVTGVWTFDTGLVETVQGQQFTPVFNKLVDSVDLEAVKRRPSNLIPNSSGELGMTGWTIVGTPSNLFGSNASQGGGKPQGPSAFYATQAHTGSTFLKTNITNASPGKTYSFGVDFRNSGNGGAASELIATLWDVTNGSSIGVLRNESSSDWHRKTLTFVVPSNTTNIEIRLAVYSSVAGYREFRRLSLVSGEDAGFWNQDANDYLLFQSVSDGKALIAGAISGKNVPTSASDSFQTMATNISNIQQGSYQSLILNRQTESSVIVNIGFTGGVELLADIPANTKALSITQAAANTTISYVRGGIPSTQIAYCLLDYQGRLWRVSAISGTSNDTWYTTSMTIDIQAGVAQFFRNAYSGNNLTFNNIGMIWQSETTVKPSGFRTDMPMQYVVAVMNNTSTTNITCYYCPGYLKIMSGS